MASSKKSLKPYQSNLLGLIAAALGSLALVTAAPSDATAMISLQASFDGSNGANPYSPMTSAGNGLYYGTTSAGGFENKGAVYAFDANTGSLSLMADFKGINLANPLAALTSAGGGIYYGITLNSPSGQGAVYSFNANTKSISFLADSTESQGGSHISALVDGGNGIFFGTSYGGGIKGSGTIYDFDSHTNTIHLRATFSCDGSNACHPWAGLTSSGNNLFYGTLRDGGANKKGGIFSFDASTNAVVLNASFDGINGADPFSSLTPGENGVYYGTTGSGGDFHQGSIYAFDSLTGFITLQANFATNGPNSGIPWSSLISVGSGLYYGTTVGGGLSNHGTVYSFDSSTQAVTLLASLNGPDGADPYGGVLTPAGADLYYGTALMGGANNQGSIFAFHSAGQQSTPASAPTPLPLLGGAVAWAWSRQLRQQFKRRCLQDQERTDRRIDA